MLMISRFENITKTPPPPNKVRFLEDKQKNTVYIVNCRTELLFAHTYSYNMALIYDNFFKCLE